MINYSFIIPHKNCTESLCILLDSIPKRNDIQIIVVDDCSDLSSTKVLKHIENNNPLVEFLYTKESGGAGYARNLGISKAKGKWLVFADSDDTFDSASLDKVMDLYHNDESDIIYFSINCLDSLTKKKVNNADKVYLKYINDSNDAENLCRYRLLPPWGKFVRRELVSCNNLKFDETKVANDGWFSLQTGFLAKKVKIDKTTVYNWLVRTGSITSNHSLEARLMHFNLAVKSNNFKEERGLQKYRSNLFFYVPMLIRSGMSYIEVVSLVIKCTPVSFWLKDIVSATLFFLNK